MLMEFFVRHALKDAIDALLKSVKSAKTHILSICSHVWNNAHHLSLKMLHIAFLVQLFVLKIVLIALLIMNVRDVIQDIIFYRIYAIPNALSDISLLIIIMNVSYLFPLHK